MDFTSAGCFGIVSMMDCALGQRQFSDLLKLEAYLRDKRHSTDAQRANYVTFPYELKSRVVVSTRWQRLLQRTGWG